jgi:hypothetical protein
MKPKVYLETTIPSYLTSRPSRDLLVAAHQQLTSDWWNDHRDRFSLFISERVLREAGSGDASAAARRLAELAGVPHLEFTPEALDLAKRFLAEGVITGKICGGCHSRRHRHGERDGLPIDMELPAHCQCRDREASGEDSGGRRLLIARPLHARAIDGTLKSC